MPIDGSGVHARLLARRVSEARGIHSRPDLAQELLSSRIPSQPRGCYGARTALPTRRLSAISGSAARVNMFTSFPGVSASESAICRSQCLAPVVLAHPAGTWSKMQQSPEPISAALARGFHTPRTARAKNRRRNAGSRRSPKSIVFRKRLPSEFF